MSVLAKFQMAYRWDPDLHPRGEHGRFAGGSGGGAPSFSAAPLVEDDSAARRSRTRGESWQRVGAKLAELPVSYTGSKNRERAADGWKELQVSVRSPTLISPEEHQRTIAKLKRIVSQEREPAIEKAKVTRKKVAVHGIKDFYTLKRRTGPLILDPETPKGTVHRAYNHAAAMAMHSMGPIVYGPFRMSDDQKAELEPLTNFMRYTNRRLIQAFEMHPDLRRNRQLYRAEFGESFPNPKFDRVTGKERMRLPPNQQFVKLAKFDEAEHPRDKNGRWSSLGISLASGGAAGGVALATPYVRDLRVPLTGRLAPKQADDEKARVRNKKRARAWMDGSSAVPTVRHFEPERGLVVDPLLADVRGDAQWTVDAAARRAHIPPGEKISHLWRGVHHAPAEALSTLKPGDEFTMRAPSSWSRDSKIATRFSKGKLTVAEDPKKKVARTRIFLRHLDDKTQMFDVNAAVASDGGAPHRFRDEKEVVLGPGSKLRVDRVRDSKAGRVMFASVVKQDAEAAIKQGLLGRYKSPLLHASRLGIGAYVGAMTAMPVYAGLHYFRSQEPASPVEKLAKFDEGKHPRGKGGEFAAGAGQARPAVGDETGRQQGVQATAGAVGGAIAGGALGAKALSPVWHGVDRMAGKAGKAVEARVRLNARRTGANTHFLADKMIRSQGRMANGFARAGARFVGRNAVGLAAFTAGDYLGDRISRTAMGVSGDDDHYRHMNATGFLVGSAAAAGTHALQNGRWARKIGRKFGARGKWGILGGAIAATAGMELGGTRVQDRIEHMFDGLGKRAATGCADERVAAMLVHAHHALRQAGRRHARGVSDPHVVAVLPHVRDILGVERPADKPGDRMNRTARVADHRIPLADVLAR